MKGFFSMVLRELKALRKEKTIMFAILIQLFIASFSSVILLGIMVYYDPDSIGQNAQLRLDVGVLGDTQSQFTNLLEQRHHRVRVFSDAAKAETAFKAGRLDAIVYIPEDSKDVVEMKLVLPEMDAQATLVLMLLKEPLEKYENYLREQQGLIVRYQDIKGKPFSTNEFLYTIIIPILMFFPAFIAGSMVIDSISEEMENKTLETLLSAPVSINQITGAKIAASVVVGALQCIAWIILLGLNGFSVQNAWIILILSMLVIAIVALLALLVSLVFRDRERSQFIYSLVILVLFSLTYFVNPSPFALVARLATGDPFVGAGQLLVYVIMLGALVAVTPFITKRLTRV
ncbi:MAG: ABC transporter permease [Dehalococcoidia bacterium]|nr:ABC transporter permease [Dehalococcoidia bacterium]MDD5493296.1 ABC transporter permease [Dehalococcoidia bacterium]